MTSPSSEAIPAMRIEPESSRADPGASGSAPLAPSALPTTAPPLREAERERELAGLRRAESVLVGVRVVTIVGWPFLLFRQPLPVATELVVAFYALALAYTVATAVLARTAGPRIRVVAIATTVADSITVAVACFLTGGLASIAMPAFYLTVIATAIRFGMRESFAIVVWTGVELAIVSQTAPGSTATLRDLATDVFYLSGVALMSGLLAGEARRQDRRALRQGDRARLLLAVDRAIHSTLDLEVLLPRILDEALEVIPCRGAGIVLLDRRTGAPDRMVVAGELPAPEAEAVRRSLEAGLLADVRRGGVVVLEGREAVHARLVSQAIRPFVSESLLAIALRRREDAGYLVLVDRHGGGGFTANDVELLRAVADLAAVAIEDARLVDDLRDASERSRELLRRLLQAGEEERQRIAGELHDRLGAEFSELLFAIRRCRALAGEIGGLAGALAELEAKASRASTLVRTLMNDLRPSVLDDFGFGDALRDHVASIPGGPAITLRLDDAAPSTKGSRTDAILFRIAQEAILNARKHSGAATLTIEHRLGDDGRIELVVADDGRGFDPAAPAPGHHGLRTMRERVEAAGGELEIESGPGRGTRIRVRLPAEETA